MAWTTPATYATGETMTAAKMNLIRDNLLALKSPPGGVVNITSDLTTNSTTPVDVTGASVTLTVAGTVVLIWFTGAIYADGTGVDVRMRFAVDGSGSSTIMLSDMGNGIGTAQDCSFIFRNLVSAGSRTIKLQWWCGSAGNITLPGTQAVAQFGVFELT